MHKSCLCPSSIRLPQFEVRTTRCHHFTRSFNELRLNNLSPLNGNSGDRNKQASSITPVPINERVLPIACTAAFWLP